jgi:hypothetical protein
VFALSMRLASRCWSGGTLMFAAYSSRHPNARKTQGRGTRLRKIAALVGTGIASERGGEVCLKGVRT